MVGREGEWLGGAHHSPLTTHHSPLTPHPSPLTPHRSPLNLHPTPNQVRLQPQVATEGSPELEDPYPGLELLLRKSRLATLYDISVGRLCVTDERPKAKEKCPSPEGTVVRPDGKVLGRSLTRT